MKPRPPVIPSIKVKSWPSEIAPPPRPARKPVAISAVQRVRATDVPTLSRAFGLSPAALHLKPMVVRNNMKLATIASATAM